MKNISLLVALMSVIIFNSCAPKVTTSISKTQATTNYNEDIVVYSVSDPFPENCEVLGTVKIGDSGFTMKCNLEIVTNLAKIEARKAGGNAVKITEHKTPDLISTCHRINASILKVNKSITSNKIAETKAIIKSNETTNIEPTNSDSVKYATLYLYRLGGMGALVSYNVHVDNDVVWRCKNNYKTKVKVYKEGYTNIWAKTESKTEMPINIEFGNEYYIKFEVKMGAFVGRPSIQNVHESTGKIEYAAVKTESKKTDYLIRNDGKRVNCEILKEDEQNVYFNTEIKGNLIKTQLPKDKIKIIEYAN